MTTVDRAATGTAADVDSPYAWYRLTMSLLISMIGGVGLWSVVVTLPAVEAEFGVARADASLPYTLTMVGFAIRGSAMGRLAGRLGLLTTGGSDWHGGAGADNARSFPGSDAVPMAWLEAMDARREELAGR